jgi:hypothetical protein
VDGQAHGKGVMKMKNGDLYTGDFLKDQASGKGIKVQANGAEYRGDFLNNKKHGKGIEKFKSGTQFTGEFQHDKAHGKGSYEFADGSHYVGSFENGQRIGGYFMNKDGDKKKDVSGRGVMQPVVNEPEEQLIAPLIPPTPLIDP